MNLEMIEKSTSKWISFLESGVLSANEVANSLLYYLATEPDVDPAFVSLIESLPNEVKQSLLDLMQGIRDAEFHWRPFLIGEGHRDSAQFTANLRTVWAILCDSGYLERRGACDGR